ncbi:hypothetical protein SAMD00019534_022550 [Acytostelium subglobosum LB1]|uniref:hypothetical protein n=1 Tax=Acytostelium subglobosum LB1 TaxID=1410327 RepID=UPI00064497D1|nr:hypothetical protein SAMD00019534_022550 [Acytostelium subglobosum LB1]GAM19080.1 hypothetical protein SAMD00019534_022550 [Acytostelium subglobosum LB1]|eukprot:XP_012757007.1 hypothetical protein SAMD00019534_022550 [Acytostelium subglobosum LB1]
MSDSEGEDDGNLDLTTTESLEPKLQALLQTFIARRIIEHNTLAAIMEVIKIHYRDNSGTIEDYIHSINSMIMQVNMQIKNMRTESKHYYCLTNLKADESSKLTTKYNATETTYFKALIEEMIQKGGELKNSHCLDLHLQGQTKTKAEEALQKFKDDGWITDSTNNTSKTLTPRALMDLAPILTELPECFLCHQRVLTVNGHIEACANSESCTVTLHQHCSAQYFKKATNCPSCKQRFK